MPDTITPTSCSVAATQPGEGQTDRSRSASRKWEAVPRYASRKLEDGSWELRVELPGVRRSDLSVSLEDQELEVVAARHRETPDGWKALRVQRVPDCYRLAVALGVPVDSESVAAKLENGVLRLTLSAPEEAKPRRISVN